MGWKNLKVPDDSEARTAARSVSSHGPFMCFGFLIAWQPQSIGFTICQLSAANMNKAKNKAEVARYFMTQLQRWHSITSATLFSQSSQVFSPVPNERVARSAVDLHVLKLLQLPLEKTISHVRHCGNANSIYTMYSINYSRDLCTKTDNVIITALSADLMIGFQLTWQGKLYSDVYVCDGWNCVPPNTCADVLITLWPY